MEDMKTFTVKSELALATLKIMYVVSDSVIPLIIFIAFWETDCTS